MKTKREKEREREREEREHIYIKRDWEREIYIYIYRERERVYIYIYILRDGERATESNSMTQLLFSSMSGFAMCMWSVSDQDAKQRSTCYDFARLSVYAISLSRANPQNLEHQHIPRSYKHVPMLASTALAQFQVATLLSTTQHIV